MAKNLKLDSFTKELMENMLAKPSTALVKSENNIRLAQDDETNNESPLLKSILNTINNEDDQVFRLAFEQDPSVHNQFYSVYRAKTRLIPDTILKRIAIADELVAALSRARANQISSFGRPRPTRFETGYIIEPKPTMMAKLEKDQLKELQERIERAIVKLSNCGETKGWDDQSMMSFPQFLYVSTHNAIILGRVATEVIWTKNFQGEKVFHSFRPIDAGTIYRAMPQKNAEDAIRRNAKALLERIKNKKLDPEKFQADEYTWIQVVEGTPKQAFTSEECLVHNFYPANDIELDGYPVTPLDTIASAVTTHINITNYNKMYFQTGRASRGMLVIQSDDVDEKTLARLKQQFNSQINSVANAWRMPVFNVGKDDAINWQPIDNGVRDMEFQYLSDMNARIILSAFQMSPEELPGYSHLSRGTNSQALCLDPNSKIYTSDGYLTINEILNGEEEKQIIVWTGTSWNEAKAFKTGKRKQVKTKFISGAEIVTSPDHKFLVPNPNEFDSSHWCEWHKQSDLQEGHAVFINKYDPYEDELPEGGFKYNTDYVLSIEKLDNEIEMVDVEVFNDEHAFIANGIVVHNSETSNEYKLQAHRDLGFRPLMKHFEDFINSRILPLIDPYVAKYCTLKFSGLDADNQEKESTRLAQDQQLHYTYNEILEKVEKKKVDKKYGGDFPLNPNFQANLDKYFTVGEIKEHFFGIEDASKDPKLAYHRDPLWMQWQTMMQAQQQALLAPEGTPPSPAGDKGPPKAPGSSSSDNSTGELDGHLSDIQEQLNNQDKNKV